MDTRADTSLAPGRRNSSDNSTATQSNDNGNEKEVSDITQEKLITGNIPADMATQILHAIQTQNEEIKTLKTLQTNVQKDLKDITKDLVEIKSDIGQVKKKCDDIEERCSRLEIRQKDLSDIVAENKKEISKLLEDNKRSNRKMTDATSTMEELVQKISDLTTDVDKLEEFSRRDNLRIFGIPHEKEREDYDTCARAVVNALNSVESPIEWTTDDIIRAHRVGQEQGGKPKTMIVKLNRWKDKMTILRDRNYRDRLDKEKGIRVASDLTKRQADIVREARNNGKVAFFRNGKLVVGPPRPDPRTYAEAAATPRDRIDEHRTTRTNTANTADDRRDATITTRNDTRRDDCSVNDDTGAGQACSSPVSDRGVSADRSPRDDTARGRRKSADRSDVRPKPGGQSGLRGYFTASPSTPREQRNRAQTRPTDNNATRRTTRKTSQK